MTVEGVDRARPGVWLPIGSAGLAVGLLYVAIFAVPPLITTFVDDLGLSHSQAGALMSICLGAFLVSSLASGSLIARFGTTRVIVAGLVLCGTACACFSLTDSFPLFLLWRAALGVAGGLIYAPGIAFVASLVPFDRANYAIGVYLTGLAAGSVTAFFVTRPLAEWLSWRWPFWIFGATALAGAVIFRAVAGPPPAVTGRRERGAKSPAREVLASPPFLLLLAGVFGSMFAAYGVFTWVVPYFDESAGFSTGQISFASGVMTSAAIPGTFAAGWLADRTRRPLGVAAVGIAFGALLVAFAISSSPSLAVAIVIGTFATLGVALGLTPLFAMPPLLFQASTAGTASGLATAAGMGGAVASTYVGGWIVGASGYSAAFSVYTVMAVVTALAIIPLAALSLRRWRAAAGVG